MNLLSNVYYIFTGKSCYAKKNPHLTLIFTEVLCTFTCIVHTRSSKLNIPYLCCNCVAGYTIVYIIYDINSDLELCWHN